MTHVPAAPLEALVGDPDDYRPNSFLRLIADPGDDAGQVDDLTVIIEDVAPGDQIPLHRHPIDEVVVIVSGEGEIRLGSKTFSVGPGSVVFVPAGAPHGTRNTGDGALRLHAVAPSTLIEITMLERNPAPGTEAAPPSQTVYDARTGEFRVIG
jgi:quercetin dioxygenase-like cupin family protein